jgi:hypothetical protein
VNYDVVETMSELMDFNPGQAGQMQHLEQMWPEYSHALRVAAATSGGMGWKTVNGVEYLVRYYRQDGKKKFTSHGRRDEATEAMYKRFQETIVRAREIVKERRDEVALACRLAKAHELARLPGRQAETLQWFWYAGATDRLSLFGGTALLAYEGKAGALAPADMVKEDRLQFIARTSDVAALGLDEIEEACDVDRTGCVIKRGRGKITISTTDDEPRAEILLPDFFFRRASDDLVADAYAEALDRPRWTGLTVSRDCRPIELIAVDSRAYVILAGAFGDDQIWRRRASVAAAMGELIDPEWDYSAVDNEGPSIGRP